MGVQISLPFPTKKNLITLNFIYPLFTAIAAGRTLLFSFLLMLHKNERLHKTQG